MNTYIYNYVICFYGLFFVNIEYCVIKKTIPITVDYLLHISAHDARIRYIIISKN